MSLTDITFYLFALVLLVSAGCVVTTRNPVHAVLFLILAFFNAAGLFILIGAEFVAMILVIVYVGAVAVLFLFVVMMLDINFQQLRQGFYRHLPTGLLIGGLLAAQLIFLVTTQGPIHLDGAAASALPTTASNIHAIGRILYTDYFYPFQLSGLVLLVAMIGAIVLTLRTRTGVRRQSVARQVARTREETVAVRKVSSGGGI
jgi:NADH-quinone oxidoreductase subunit J